MPPQVRTPCKVRANLVAQFPNFSVNPDESGKAIFQSDAAASLGQKHFLIQDIFFVTSMLFPHPDLKAHMKQSE